jgi:hypothetical protein
MITADYYPNKSRLDFLAPDGMPTGGIMGEHAHVKAAQLLQSNNALVRVCVDSKMNRRNYKKQKAKSSKQKTLNL